MWGQRDRGKGRRAQWTMGIFTYEGEDREEEAGKEKATGEREAGEGGGGGEQRTEEVGEVWEDREEEAHPQIDHVTLWRVSVQWLRNSYLWSQEVFMTAIWWQHKVSLLYSIKTIAFTFIIEGNKTWTNKSYHVKVKQIK